MSDNTKIEVKTTCMYCGQVYVEFLNYDIAVGIAAPVCDKCCDERGLK